jgi:phosphoglycerate dehydrogenase-like enzyme
VIARWGVGYDRIDVAACSRAGILVAITPDAVRRPVAEGIFTLIFALAKNLRLLDERCRAGKWRDSMPQSAISLEGKTLGSVGAGNIASEMFRIAHGIGFGRLLASDPFAAAPVPGVEMAPLETVMKESDFVAVNCPLTPETEGLIGVRELGWMKPTAYLINTARGPIVDESALVDALQTRRIAGAGLDVFHVEPVPSDHPLLKLDNVVVSPHAIAWTRELARDNGILACRNVLEVAHGRVPRHIANREALSHPMLLEKLERFRKLAAPAHPPQEGL